MKYRLGEGVEDAGVHRTTEMGSTYECPRQAVWCLWYPILTTAPPLDDVFDQVSLVFESYP